jgi:methionyl-tRNA formyltransferase
MNPKRLLFLGSKEAGLMALRQLVEQLPAGSVPAILCPDDRSDSRSEHENFSTLARQYDLPLHLVTTTQETTELIGRYAPHTVLVHGWYRMIPVAGFPDIDFLGFHYSPLPRYRGSAPLVWQILNGEEQLGVSFFNLTEGMDDGDLVDQSLFALRPDEDVSDAIRKANELVATMLKAFIPRWLAGSVPKRAQPDCIPSYCGLRAPEDGQIDWRSDARAVNNFIRAQAPPYPGAFSLLNDGSVVRFWHSEIEPRHFMGVPGAVVEVRPDAIIVACGAGAVRIRSAQTDGSWSPLVDARLRSLKVRFK